MINSENFSSLVSAVAWPTLVLILFLVFKGELRALLQRIEKAKLPGGSEVVLYGDSKIDKGMLPKQEVGTFNGELKVVEQNSKVKWQNSGDLFWLGHDLTWAIDILLRGGTQEKIVLGLNQAHFHAKTMGFPGLIIQKIYHLKVEAETLPEEYWEAKQRRLFADKIYDVINLIGKLAQQNQPGYKSG